MIARPPRVRLASILVGGALLIFGCRQIDVTVVEIASLVVEPDETVLVEGETQVFSAEVRAPDGSSVPSTVVTWSSTDPGVVTVSESGLAEAVGAGTAEVVASARGQEGRAAVEVLAAPEIELGRDSVAFVGLVGGGDPAPVEVPVTNAGTGTVDGLRASVSFAPGQPVGWLTPILQGTSTPTGVRLVVSSGSLAPGTYEATVQVFSTTPGVRNSPAEIRVRLQMFDDRPFIVAQPPEVLFSATVGDDPLPPRTVGVSNGGAGDLTGLSVQILFFGDEAGWLMGALAGATAPTELVLTADPGTLPVGRHEAEVRISSPVAPNSPLSLPVAIDVGSLPIADLSVRKSGATTADVEDTVRMIVTVENLGPAEGLDVVAVDSVPGGFSVVSATGGGEISGRIVRWSAGTWTILHFGA